MLLKVGRHIRPKPHFKVIVAREEGENRYLEGYRQTFLSIRATSHKGPLALIDGQADESDIEFATRIVARYGQGKNADSITAEVRFPDGQLKELTVAPFAADDIDPEWHV